MAPQPYIHLGDGRMSSVCLEDRKRLEPRWWGDRQPLSLPGQGLYQQQSDLSPAAHCVCARAVGSQSCCQSVRSVITLCSPDTSPWGDTPALWGLFWICFPTLPSPPSLPTPGAAQLWQRCSRRNTKFCMCCQEGLSQPCLQQPPQASRDYHNLTSMAGRARCAFTLTCLLRQNTWQHTRLQKSYWNNTPSLGRQGRYKQPVTDVSCVAQGFTKWHLQNRRLWQCKNLHKRDELATSLENATPSPQTNKQNKQGSKWSNGLSFQHVQFRAFFSWHSWDKWQRKAFLLRHWNQSLRRSRSEKQLK